MGKGGIGGPIATPKVLLLLLVISATVGTAVVVLPAVGLGAKMGLAVGGTGMSELGVVTGCPHLRARMRRVRSEELARAARQSSQAVVISNTLHLTPGSNLCVMWSKWLPAPSLQNLVKAGAHCGEVVAVGGDGGVEIPTNVCGERSRIVFDSIKVSAQRGDIVTDRGDGVRDLMADVGGKSRRAGHCDVKAITCIFILYGGG
jgi:hypothetical protein